MLLDDKNIKHVHCVGIGGIGVSGIAEILLKKGYHVTGSDTACGKTVEYLRQLGISVYEGHRKENVGGAEALIYSSAVDQNNPEYIAALEAKLPLIPRGKMLAELFNTEYGVAIAGTHGKTTTTSLIAYILSQAGVDPTFLIGGIIKNSASPAYLGKSQVFIAEADESDASFLYLKPRIAVVLNIDADHLETYDGDLEQLKNAFIHFLNQIPDDGKAILCIDDPAICEILPKIKCPVITFGFNAAADFKISEFQQQNMLNKSVLYCQRNKQFFSVELQIPGRHNALNAAAAIAVADALQVDINKIMEIIKTFPGVGRRFQNHGEVVLTGKKILLLEDYGHHPNEIKATIAAMRAVWPQRRLTMVFQPHRYSRTRDLLQEFAVVLNQVDYLVLLDIYSAGEGALAGLTGMTLKNAIAHYGEVQSFYVSEIAQLPTVLPQLVNDGDVVIFQGAGNVGYYASLIVSKFSESKK